MNDTASTDYFSGKDPGQSAGTAHTGRLRRHQKKPPPGE